MSHKQWRDWVSPDIDDIKVSPDLPVRRTRFALICRCEDGDGCSDVFVI